MPVFYYLLKRGYPEKMIFVWELGSEEIVAFSGLFKKETRFR